MSKSGMWNAEGRDFAHELSAINDFFYLGRADSIARSFHHLVAATDEVKKPFLILTHRVARKNSDLWHHPACFTSGQRLIAFSGYLGVIPVSHSDYRAAMH